MKTYTEYKLDEKLNPKKQFALTTQVQDSIKTLCKNTIDKEAKACHENKSSTYDAYIKEATTFMAECLNECMELYTNSSRSTGGIY